MWTVSRMICMGVLISLSVVDIYYRKIPVDILIMGSLSALGYQIFIEKGDPWLILGGTGIGILFLLVSKITGEGIGYGDSWAILIMGVYLGIWRLLEVLAGAFLILAAVSGVGLAVKRMSRKLRIPFFPFLAAGYLISVAVWN